MGGHRCGAVTVSDAEKGSGDVQCRPAGAGDLAFLATMLGEAAVWRPDEPTPSGDEVPELSIAVIASRRGKGIGRRLLIELINAVSIRGTRL